MLSNRTETEAQSRSDAIAPAPAPPPSSAPKPLFGDVFEEYLGQLKRPDRRQIADYRRLWKKHVSGAIVVLRDGSVIGPLGAVPIDQITTEVIQAWVTWMEARRWSRDTARTTQLS
jgi:hypothetical protein